MTWAPTEGQLAAALAHAAACSPGEAGGVISAGRYHPMQNLAAGDYDRFVMDMRHYLEIDRAAPVEAIVHSHVKAAPTASEADRTMCEATAKPWLIVSWPSGHYRVIEPNGFRAPLVGRSWAWGVHDCFTLMRDGILDYAGVRLPELSFEWGFWETRDHIREVFRPAGFYEVDGPWLHCDVAVMRIPPARYSNHVGLFLAPETILHQFADRYSRRDLFGPWLAKTTMHLRHETLAGVAYG